MALPVSESLITKEKRSKKELRRDSGNGEDNIYEVEKIVGMTKVEGETFYRVRWLGFTAQDDTLEPYENLITCKHVIEEFLERQKKKKRKAVNATHKPVRKKSSSHSTTDSLNILSEEVSIQNVKQTENNTIREIKTKDSIIQKGLVDSSVFIMDLMGGSSNQNAPVHPKPKVKGGVNAPVTIKRSTSNKTKSTVESSASTGAGIRSTASSKSSVTFPTSYLSSTDQNMDFELIGEPRVARTSVSEASSSTRPLKYIPFSQHSLIEQSSQQQTLKSDNHQCQKDILQSLIKIELGNDNGRKSHNSSSVSYSGLNSQSNTLIHTPAVSSALATELCNKLQKPLERISDHANHQNNEFQSTVVTNGNPKENLKETSEHSGLAEKKAVISEILDRYVRSGNYDKLKEIIASHKDCDLECPSSSGTTLLMRAAIMGHYAITELLIMNGADLNAKHSTGVTALISAATNGHFYVLSLLLALGAHMDVRANGTTALIEATKRGDNHMIRELLEYGANFSIKDNNQMTALDHAKKLKNGIAEKIILNHIERVVTAFEAKVNSTISNTAQLLCPLFPIHCLALNESTSFVIYFDYKFEHCPPGVGMLLFIAHAFIKGNTDIKCRLHGTCAVNSVILNNKLQMSLTEDGNYILSFSPIRDGKNKLEIKTCDSPTTEVKLLVCAYKAQLCVPD